MSKDNIRRTRIEDPNVKPKDKATNILLRDDLKALLEKYDIEEYLVSFKLSESTSSMMAECYDEYITNIVLNLMETNPEAVKIAIAKYLFKKQAMNPLEILGKILNKSLGNEAEDLIDTLTKAFEKTKH